jgi:hypothetical protein
VSDSYSAVIEPDASLARGSRRAIRILAIAISVLLLFAAAAQAQGVGDRPERSERRDTDGKTPEKSADKDFTIGIDIPARYSSNVTSASTDSIVENRPDGHVTPEVYLKWSHQYDWFKASAEIGASVDRYFKTSDANLDSLHSTLKIAKTDGKHEYFVPYAMFSTDMFFLPTFKTPDITYNDVAAGFYSGLAWRDKQRIPYVDSLIPYSDAGEPGDVSFLFDARFGRRMSDTASYQNTFASARVTGTYFISSDWRVEANTGIRARWYEDYHGERRTDWRPSAALGLIWTPDWLKKLAKRSELSLNLEYYRNYSNIPDKSYSLWEVGPTLSLRTKF